MAPSKWFQDLKNRIVPILAAISIEPVFFLDGLGFSNMIVFVESLQFDKICVANLNYTKEICNNFEEFPHEKELYNSQVTAFKRNDGIITSAIPLLFILFIGSWSDKYGRKVPLVLTLFCHILYAGGYLINASASSWPVEILLFVGFLESLGGGAVAFLTVANAFISDVTSEESRTSRVALANSLWFLGGPVGTLMGTGIYNLAGKDRLGYIAVFTTSLCLYVVAILYIILLLPESHGPFCDTKRMRKIAKKKPTIRMRDTIIRVYGISKKRKPGMGPGDGGGGVKKTQKPTVKKMFFDFFDLKRLVLSFKCVFRKRDGFTRLFILLLILANFLRKIGRGAYAFYFTKEVLKWQAPDYGYWVTYKNIITTLGSLVAVPILSTRLKVSDTILAIIGSLSSVGEYILYGLVNMSTSFLMWLAPFAALLINSCCIALRAMMSKYVTSDELGKVSAVTGTLEGIVPVISTSIYSAITKNTFDTFAGAQYFFGAGCNIAMTLLFVVISVMDRGADYDLESAKEKRDKAEERERKRSQVSEKSIVMRTDSNWLFEPAQEGQKLRVRLSTILLTSLNFSIEVSSIEKVYSKKKKLSRTGALEDVEENFYDEDNVDEENDGSIKMEGENENEKNEQVITIEKENKMTERDSNESLRQLENVNVDYVESTVRSEQKSYTNEAFEDDK